MLELIIDNKKVDLKNALNLTFRNPIFDKNGLPKGYSFPFAFNWTDTNASIFGHSYRLDSTNLQKKYSASILLFSDALVQGFVYVTYRDSKGGKAHFFNEIRDIAERLKDITIRNLLDVSPLVPNVNPAKFKYSLTTGTYVANDIIRIRINNYNYQFQAHSVFGSGESADYILNFLKGAIENQGINQFDVNEVVVMVTTVGTTSTIEIIPTIYAKQFFVQVNFDNGNEQYNIFPMTIIEERFQHGAISEAVSAFQKAKLTAGTHLFGNYNNVGAYEDRSDFNGNANTLDDNGDYIINSGNTEKNKFQQTATPLVKTSHLFDQIINELSLTHSGNFPNDLDLEDVLIFNPKTIDLEVLDDGDLYFNTFDPSYNLKNHVPDSGAADIFSRLKDAFFVYFELDNGILIIRHIADQLASNAIDLTEYVDNNYGYSTPEVNNYEVILDKDDNDKYEDASLDDYTQGDATETHTMTDTTNGIISQQQDSNFALRFVKYNGIVDNQPQIEVYDTPTNAYNNNRLFFQYLFNSRTITVNAALPPAILLKLIIFENPIIRIETENGNVQGVVESIRFKGNATKMSKTKLEIRVI